MISKLGLSLRVGSLIFQLELKTLEIGVFLQNVYPELYLCINESMQHVVIYCIFQMYMLYSLVDGVLS